MLIEADCKENKKEFIRCNLVNNFFLCKVAFVMWWMIQTCHKESELCVF